MDAAALRARFPVCERLTYLNAGTFGPLPAAAAEAGSKVLEAAAAHGRLVPYFEQLLALQDRQRAAYAALLNAEPEDVALTTSTSDGMVRVLTGLDLGPGDEIVTSDEEHPGLLGPLAAVRAQRGVTVRAVPFEEVAQAAGPATKLVACSHVGWVSGKVAPDLGGLAVPVLLDGAQGIGAVPTDPRGLGATFYAGAGQKWLCGPMGTGVLWVHPDWHERLAARGPTYLSLEDPSLGLDARPHPTARRYDAPSIALESVAAAAASFVVLAEAGWDQVHSRACGLAAGLARSLAERGRIVAPRGDTTLVAFEDAAPVATKERLAAQGIVVRDLPGTSLLRASVGAWNDESDLERLLSAL